MRGFARIFSCFVVDTNKIPKFILIDTTLTVNYFKILNIFIDYNNSDEDKYDI